jgi:hypothetical protein
MTVAKSRSKSIFDDISSSDFLRVNGDDGIYLADIEYKFNKSTLNTYYYYGENLYSAYGTRL